MVVLEMGRNGGMVGGSKLVLCVFSFGWCFGGIP